LNLLYQLGGTGKVKDDINPGVGVLIGSFKIGTGVVEGGRGKNLYRRALLCAGTLIR